MKNLFKITILLLIIGIAFGCEKDKDAMEFPNIKGQLIDTFIHNGIERSYMVYTPKSYDGQEAFPLFFALHPLMTWDSVLYTFFDATNYDELVERENFILAVPKAVK